MKLFPYHPPPAPVRGWHVPVPKMKLVDIVDPTWDLTLQKIIPHVDGVNDVLALKEREFVLAAKSIGTPARRMIPRHILPNVMSSIMVSKIRPISGIRPRPRDWFTKELSSENNVI